MQEKRGLAYPRFVLALLTEPQSKLTSYSTKSVLEFLQKVNSLAKLVDLISKTKSHGCPIIVTE